MSNCWFSVCLRIFCLVVLILLPKLLELELRGFHKNTASCTEQQQILDLVSSVFDYGGRWKELKFRRDLEV